MNSGIFESLGMEGLDPAILFIIFLVLILILLTIIIVQGASLKKLRRTYEGFMKGKNGRSMEKEIMDLFDDIRYLKSAQKTDRRNIRTLRDNLVYTYQKMGLVRYDAFNQMGGTLSFSLALLNDRNDGFIINSVHSSDGCYSYAKEIRGGQCQIALGEEEQRALRQALEVGAFSSDEDDF